MKTIFKVGDRVLLTSAARSQDGWSPRALGKLVIRHIEARESTGYKRSFFIIACEGEDGGNTTVTETEIQLDYSAIE